MFLQLRVEPFAKHFDLFDQIANFAFADGTGSVVGYSVPLAPCAIEVVCEGSHLFRQFGPQFRESTCMKGGFSDANTVQPQERCGELEARVVRQGVARIGMKGGKLSLTKIAHGEIEQ